MNIIGLLLFEYRQLHKLTQKDLVEILSFFSDEFKAISTVTLSRWETGSTSPGLNKKKILMHFLASRGCLYAGACHDITKDRYDSLLGPLSGVFTRNYQYLIGNLPLPKAGKHTIRSLKSMVEKREHIEHIIDIEIATNATNYYTVSPKILAEWCKNPSSFCIVCERKKQHLGHFIMLKIKTHTAEDIAHHRRSEFSLTVDDFCDPQEKGTYYVHALYGRDPNIAAELNVLAYLHLFDNMEYIDNIMIFSSRTDGLLLTKDYGIQIIDSGEDDKYGFSWYGMLSPVEDILFSDTVVKLIF